MRESRYSTQVIYTRYETYICAFELSARGRYGPEWTGGDMIKNFGGTKDYLGIIFPIAISAVGTSLMALVSAKAAGITRRIRLRAVRLAVIWLNACSSHFS